MREGAIRFFFTYTEALSVCIHLLHRLQSCQVLVVGDLMLDAYTFCSVNRISPEAPVPVALVKEEEFRAGGAGNVALNLRALGAGVKVMGRVGEDREGKLLLQALAREGCDTSLVVREAHYPTTLKNRVMAEGQQVVRVDKEKVSALTEEAEKSLLFHLDKLLEGVDIVAVSDYNKGALTASLFSALVERCQGAQIPVVVDPKGKDFSKYRGAQLIKPNELEAYIAAGASECLPIDQVAKALLESTGIDVLMITRSAKGISVFSRAEKQRDFPTCARDVVDVTGAGDTVLAMVALALASGLNYSEATQLANLAAGVAVETVGCARVTKELLQNRTEGAYA